MKTIHVNYIH